MNKQFHPLFSLLILTMLIVVSTTSKAQPGDWSWANSYGSKFPLSAFSCVADMNDNVVTTGRFRDTVDFDPGTGVFNLIGDTTTDNIFLTKNDSAGNLLWAFEIGGNTHDASMAIASFTSTGDIYITGYFTGTTDFDPGPNVFNLTSNGNEDVFIAKYTSAGNLSWAKSVGGNANDRGLVIAVHPVNGNVYYSGIFAGNVDFDPGVNTNILSATGSGNNLFNGMFDSSGNFSWVASVGNISAGTISVFSLKIDVSGNGSIVSTGQFEGPTDFDTDSGTVILTDTDGDVFILKQELNGHFLWARSIGGPGADQGNALAIGMNGEIFVTGYYSQTCDMDPGPGTANITSLGGTDIFLLQLAANGNYIRSGSMGSAAGNDFSTGIISNQNTIYVSGGFQSSCDFDPLAGTFFLNSSGSTDNFIVKTDTAFNFDWVVKNGSAGSEYSLTISIDHSGLLFLSGTFTSASLTLGNDVLTAITPATADVFTGRFNPSVTTSILNPEKNSISFEIFPNPANEVMNLRTNNFNQEFNISITDYSGRIIASYIALTGKNFQVNTGSWEEGVYFIHLQTGNQFSSRKLILVH